MSAFGSAVTRNPRVAIVGAGVSGLCAAIKLREAGIDTFTIYEKSTRVGGTWQYNTYPGLFVDVPSRYFQYSFALNPDWSHVFPPGEEVRRYLEGVADDFDVRDKIEFGTEMTRGEWADDHWQLTTADGRVIEADFVVTGCGFLHKAVTPQIDGLEDFAGPVFHSSEWDHSVDIAGSRVAVIGNGSTGVQIVTALAGRTAALTHFVRTPQWVFPAPNPRYRGLGSRLMRRFPALTELAYRGWQRTFEGLLCQALISPGWRRRLVQGLCRANLRSIRDPELRRKLTPDFEPGCKRLVISAGYYRALQRHPVGVVREGIHHVEPNAVVTADGARHEVDVVVLATGFDTRALVRPMEFTGPDGRTLSDLWSERLTGYGTVAVPGLPNLFMAMGPKSPVNISSIFNVAEVQVGYIVDMIGRWKRGEIGALTVTDEATERFERELAGSFDGTVWLSGCDSWYIGPDGSPEIWPWMPHRHRAFLAEPKLDDYRPVAPGTPNGMNEENHELDVV